MHWIGSKELSQLLEQHGRGLVLYARQWTDSPEDVVQDALMLLMRQAERPVNVVAWMYQVVRNRSISMLRSAERRTRHETMAAKANAAWFCPADSDRLDSLEASRALADLPDEQREAIIARLWGGLSFEQIATVIGCSSSSAHRWYEKGLSALRERLGESCSPKKS